MAETMIETARLRLRTWDAADIAPFKVRLNTPAVMQWLGGVQDDAAFQAFYDRVKLSEASNGFCFWIVERLADDALLGFCGMKRVNSEGAAMTGDVEIAWRLAEDAWGHGYAREAAEACLNLAFERFAAPHVVALTVVGNAPSWGLMMRLGMTRARALDFTGGFSGAGHEPIIVYKIERRDWTQ